VLDPAHGGPDPGARLGGQVPEKDVTLALAAHLRSALQAAGFTVVSTRDSDLATALAPDQRAEIANRQHVLACLVLHATSAGSGAHLYVSTLAAATSAQAAAHPPFTPVPWDRAQASAIPQSLDLRAKLYDALEAAQIPALRGRASVPPLDNLLCPAVALEVAPRGAASGDRTSPTDAGYQQRVADAVAAALKAFRNEAQPAEPAEPAGAAQ
jgi:N-acetylmuramoyl-L-alanine amidase